MLKGDMLVKDADAGNIELFYDDVMYEMTFWRCEPEPALLHY